jgi:hypothetical protein
VRKELSQVQQDFGVEEADRELSTGAALPTGTNVAECWMDIAGARMHY